MPGWPNRRSWEPDYPICWFTVSKWNGLWAAATLSMLCRCGWNRIRLKTAQQGEWVISWIERIQGVGKAPPDGLWHWFPLLILRGLLHLSRAHACIHSPYFEGGDWEWSSFGDGNFVFGTWGLRNQRMGKTPFALTVWLQNWIQWLSFSVLPGCLFSFWCWICGSEGPARHVVSAVLFQPPLPFR